jgi:hypothetical protein
MNAPKKIQDLIGDVAHFHSDARLRYAPLPSGVCFLWVSIGNRNFVLEYHPTEGTGVSENFDDTPPFVGHDTTFDSLDDAVEHFKSLLADAAQTEAEHMPQAFVLNDKKM